jgi:hypothetical protein
VLTSTGDSRASTQRGFEREPGEVALNRSCLDCHDLTPIRTQAYDSEGWSGIVDQMVGHGATVEEADRPALTEYLARTYGPLPEGEGKNVLLNNCTICHNRDRIFAHAGVDREHWETTLLSMLNEGALLTDEEFGTLLNYLDRNFGL